MSIEERADKIMNGRRRVCMDVHVKRGWYYTPTLFWLRRNSTEQVLGEHPGIKPDMTELNIMRSAAKIGYLNETVDELPHLWRSKGDSRDGYDVTVYKFTWTLPMKGDQTASANVSTAPTPAARQYFDRSE